MAASQQPSKKRRLKLAGKLLLGVVSLWVLGDLIYSRVVARQVSQWEATVQRDADGVMQGCAAYSVGEGETALLLVHGINASPRHYDKMAPALAERGYACRVMRLPGFCKPTPDYAQSRHEAWVLAIEKELARLREKHDRIGVVAHSLGGAAAIGHFMRRPDSADFVVLLAPATAVSNERSPVLSTRAWHEIAQRTLLFTTVLQSPFAIDCHDPAHPDYPGRSPFTPRSVVNELFLLMDQNWLGVAEYRTPTLMVLTSDDRVVDWQAAERYLNESSATRKDLLFLEDSGHAITLDYGWQDVVDAVDSFAKTNAPE